MACCWEFRASGPPITNKQELPSTRPPLRPEGPHEYDRRFAGAFMAKKAQRRTIRAWLREDVRSLRSFAKARMSGPLIAKKLKRTPGAVGLTTFVAPTIAG
jgi:hypothetical protein